MVISEVVDGRHRLLRCKFVAVHKDGHLDILLPVAPGPDDDPVVARYLAEWIPDAIEFAACGVLQAVAVACDPEMEDGAACRPIRHGHILFPM